MLAAIVLVVPGIFLVSSESDVTRGTGYVLIALGSYAASFLVIYYNVILAAGANDALEGREPDLEAARRTARNRLPDIAVWALVSALVSLLLSVLRIVAVWRARIAASMGAAIWGLVTFLVVPVLALEGIGPIAAIKRSGTLVRQRWGPPAGHGQLRDRRDLWHRHLRRASDWVCSAWVMIASASTGAIVLGGVLVLLGLCVAVAAAVFGGAHPRRVRRGAVPLRRRGSCRRAIQRQRPCERRPRQLSA